MEKMPNPEKKEYTVGNEQARLYKEFESLTIFMDEGANTSSGDIERAIVLSEEMNSLAERPEIKNSKEDSKDLENKIQRLDDFIGEHEELKLTRD